MQDSRAEGHIDKDFQKSDVTREDTSPPRSQVVGGGLTCPNKGSG